MKDEKLRLYDKCLSSIKSAELEMLFKNFANLCELLQDDSELTKGYMTAQSLFSMLRKERMVGVIDDNFYYFHLNKLVVTTLELTEIFKKRYLSKEIVEHENYPKKAVILYVGASPNNKEKLNIKGEERKIKDLLNEHPFLEFQSIKGTTKDKLREMSIKHNPKILHFSCHSTHDGLFLEKENGDSDFLNLIQFEEFIRKRSRQIECVILSSCSSETLGKKISKYIPYVITMNEEIYDRDSIDYAVGFYSFLINTGADKLDFEDAHRAGKEKLTLNSQEGGFTVEILKGDFYNIRRLK